jgi:hypothetical protein
MERQWKTIRVLPADGECAPWLDDPEWGRCLDGLLARAPENVRRWLVGLLSLQLAQGGISRLAALTGMNPKTISAGRRELADEWAACPPDRVRRGGAGRKPLTETDPTLENDFDELIRHQVAGNPESDDTWVRQTLRELQKALNQKGHAISYVTVRELLKKRGMRCKPTASASRDRPTPTATRSSSTSKRRKHAS